MRLSSGEIVSEYPLFFPRNTDLDPVYWVCMKKEGGPGTLDFAAHASAIKKRRAAEESAEPRPPVDAAPDQPVSVEPGGDVVHLEIPRPPLRVLPKPDRSDAPPDLTDVLRLERLGGVASTGLSLRTLSRLDLGDHGSELIGRDFLGLLTTPEDRQKFDRLVVIETALDGLYVKPGNVGLRRSIIRSYGTEDLAADFWGSTESNWTQQPAMYTAILDELEERGFFNIRDVPPPPPTPPAAPTGRQPRRDKKRRR